MDKLLSQFSEFFGTVTQVAKDRMRNPIFSSFIFSWVVWSWKPISIFILSRTPIEARINLITENYSSVYFLFVFPAISALILHLLMPYISIWFYVLLDASRDYNDNQETKRKIKTIEIELKLEKIEKELRGVTLDNVKVAQYESEKASLESELIHQKENNKDLESELSGLKVELNKDKTAYNNDVISSAKREAQLRSNINELNSELDKSKKWINLSYHDIDKLEVDFKLLKGSPFFQKFEIIMNSFFHNGLYAFDKLSKQELEFFIKNELLEIKNTDNGNTVSVVLGQKAKYFRDKFMVMPHG